MRKETKNTILTYAMGITTFAVAMLMWLCCATCSAQSTKLQRKGKTFVEVVDSSKSGAKETDMIYVDKEGKTYNIYVSQKGKHFIIKTSKKSGKKYRKYLPKVDEQLSKQ